MARNVLKNSDSSSLRKFPRNLSLKMLLQTSNCRISKSYHKRFPWIFLNFQKKKFFFSKWLHFRKVNKLFSLYEYYNISRINFFFLIYFVISSNLFYILKFLHLSCIICRQSFLLSWPLNSGSPPPKKFFLVASTKTL